MPFRIATFLTASILGAGIVAALAGLHYLWLGAWLGAVSWLGLDAWRAQRLLHDYGLYEFAALVWRAPRKPPALAGDWWTA